LDDSVYTIMAVRGAVADLKNLWIEPAIRGCQDRDDRKAYSHAAENRRAR